MRTLHILSLLLVSALAFSGCEKESDPVYVTPKSYLPAYPGSYWDYTDGTRLKTASDYVQHQYQLAPNSTDNSAVKLVPYYNSQYLYEYQVWQDVPLFPLKKLLSESATENPWVVNEVNGVKIYRKTTRILDSLIVSYPPFNATSDSIFYSVIEVVEYNDTLGVARWNTREYYAKNVGLIRTDINNPFDSLGFVTVSTLQGYFINN